MKTLIERLREFETIGRGDEETGEYGYHPEICDEAAAEIERLSICLSDETILRERFVAHLDEARDAMEQVLDHAIDSRSNQGPIPVAFPEGETIGQREALAYIPLNELDGIRVALANIAVHGKIDAALGKVKAPLIAEPVIKEKAENVSLTVKIAEAFAALHDAVGEFTMAVNDRPNDRYSPEWYALNRVFDDTIELQEEVEAMLTEAKWGPVRQAMQEYREKRAAALANKGPCEEGREPQAPELGPHDKLPCKVSCEGGPSFGKGITLGALLGYLARRVTYNELPGVTEEQKEGFRALLAEARGTCEEQLDATNSPGRPAP